MAGLRMHWSFWAPLICVDSQRLAWQIPGKPEKLLIVWAPRGDYDSFLVFLDTPWIFWVITGLSKITFEFLSNHGFIWMTSGDLHSILLALSTPFAFLSTPFFSESFQFSILVLWLCSVFHVLPQFLVKNLSTLHNFVALWCFSMHPLFLDTSVVLRIELDWLCWILEHHYWSWSYVYGYHSTLVNLTSIIVNTFWSS